jgi:hypothetical protein
VSISKNLGTAMFALGIGGLLTRCGAPSTCLRYSDCAQGLTCAAGKCVAPASSASVDAETEGAAERVADAGVDECGTSSGVTPCNLTSSSPTDDATGDAAVDAAVDAPDE